MENGGTLEKAWSKALFGNQHMLQITSSIAEGSVEFTAPQLEQATGLSPSSVHRLLSTLCAVGLLSRVQRRAGERTQRYRRQRHAFWKATTQLRERAHSTGSTPAVKEGSTR